MPKSRNLRNRGIYIVEKIRWRLPSVSVSDFDESVSPADNFYLYAVGGIESLVFRFDRAHFLDRPLAVLALCFRAVGAPRGDSVVPISSSAPSLSASQRHNVSRQSGQLLRGRKHGPWRCGWRRALRPAHPTPNVRVRHARRKEPLSFTVPKPRGVRA